MSPGDLSEPIFSGIALGSVLAVMLGPVFFSLIQTSLHEGYRAGISFAIGVLAGDALVIALSYTFASLLNTAEGQPAFRWIGGLVLIGFGVYSFFHKIRQREVDDEKKVVHTEFLFKGFVLNVSNPAVLFFWLGVVGLVSSKTEYTRMHTAIFFVTALLTVFLLDVLKALASHWLKKILRPEFMLWLNRIVGIALIVFGVSIILGKNT